MPTYNANPPVFYNSGARYGDTVGPHKKTKRMSKIARNMSRLPITLKTAVERIFREK